MLKKWYDNGGEYRYCVCVKENIPYCLCKTYEEAVESMDNIDRADIYVVDLLFYGYKIIDRVKEIGEQCGKIDL